MRRISFVLAWAFISCLVGGLSAQEVSPTPMAAMPDFGTIFPTKQIRAPRSPFLNSAPALTVKALPAAPKLVSAPPESGKCSVPLGEMQIPADKDFSIEKQAPNADALAPMPRAALPAPSCADAPSIAK